MAIIRKIKTKEEIEKNKRINQIVAGVIMIGLMIISTAGYAFFSRDGGSAKDLKFKYNGIEFAQQKSGLWGAKTSEGYAISTAFNPKETENISISFTLDIGNFNKKPLFFTEGNQEARYEILTNLYPFIERTQIVCLKGENCSATMIQKDCIDNIVIFKEKANNTNIYKNGNCIIIEAPYTEQRKAADRIIFKIFGIQ